MQATRIIAVRHGETAWNVDTRIQGHLDIALNDTGHWQARQVARALANEPLAAVYTSDLQRAHATARIIAGVLDLPLFVEPGLREQHFGSMQGELFGDLTASSPGREHINEVRWGGGESVADVYARVLDTFVRVEAAHPGPVVLVTHGHVIQIGMSLLRGHGARDIEWFDLPNGGIVNAPPPVPAT